MPAWLDQITDALALDRVDGPVPLALVHAWHAGTIAPLLAETGIVLPPLHARAAAGEPIAAADWIAATEPVLREIYRRAYAYADAYAIAHASAASYATAHGFGADEAIEFAQGYATVNTDANVRSYADANAIANARALAAAWAAGDPYAYAAAYPAAHVQAVARAYAHSGDGPARLAEAYRRLADGLVDQMSRLGIRRAYETH